MRRFTTLLKSSHAKACLRLGYCGHQIDKNKRPLHRLGFPIMPAALRRIHFLQSKKWRRERDWLALRGPSDSPCGCPISSRVAPCVEPRLRGFFIPLFLTRRTAADTFFAEQKMAEGEGFEPPEPYGSMVFKTTAFGHSAIPP